MCSALLWSWQPASASQTARDNWCGAFIFSLQRQSYVYMLASPWRESYLCIRELSYYVENVEAKYVPSSVRMMWLSSHCLGFDPNIDHFIAFWRGLMFGNEHLKEQCLSYLVCRIRHRQWQYISFSLKNHDQEFFSWHEWTEKKQLRKKQPHKRKQ